MPGIEIAGKTIKFTVDSGTVSYEGKTVRYETLSSSPGRLVVRVGRTISEFAYSQNGNEIELLNLGGGTKFKIVSDRGMLLSKFTGGRSERHVHSEIRAPMPGLVVKMLVHKGDAIRRGSTVAILEAMKMENDIRVSSDAEVGEVMVKEGDTVEKGQVIVVLQQKIF